MKTIFTILLFITPLLCSAAGVWTPAQKITQLEEYGNGIRIYGLNISSNPAQCNNTSFALTNPSDTDQKKNRFNSAILSAFMANKNIMLKLSDSVCNANNPTYYGVRVLP